MLRLAMAAGVAALLTGGSGPDVADTAPMTREGPSAGVHIDIAQRRGGLVDVSATLTPEGGTPRTILLQMYDGETATVALPGLPGIRYHFRRQGGEVVATVEH